MDALSLNIRRATIQFNNLMSKITQAQGPVLISGAGPTGLVLAIALRKNGIPVRIIEKLASPQMGERGNGVSPRSLELHRILGTAPKVLQAIIPLPSLCVYGPDGTTPIKTIPLIPSLESTPNSPYLCYHMLGQNHHERILREYLAELGTVVEHSTELQTFVQSKQGVQATLIHHHDGHVSSETLEVPWLVGADGAHSIVRKTLGLEFLGDSKIDNKLLIVDIKLKTGPRKFLEQWGSTEAGAMVFCRPSGQESDILWMFITGENIDLESMVPSPEKIVEKFYEISKRRDIEFGDVLSSVLYRPNIRMVNKMRVDRVFVLGDAAHCHTPAGGQGLNSSIQDAINLGWKLSLAYNDIASPNLLNSFEEERLPIIATMLNKTTELARQNLQSTTGFLDMSRSTDLFQLGVNYRDSSIVLGSKRAPEHDAWPAYNTESETAALPGDRAPDAPSLVDIRSGTKTSVFELLSPARHTILVFGNDIPGLFDAIHRLPSGIVQTARIYQNGAVEADSAESDFDFMLRDECGHAYTGYNAEGLNQQLVVVVRPDGVVGARVLDGEGVTQYFDLLLG